MRLDIEETVFAIQKLKGIESCDDYSKTFRNAAENEIVLLSMELAKYSVSELVDFIVNFEGF